MAETVGSRVAAFVTGVAGAMGLTLDVAIADEPDVLRVDISGDGAELFVRRRGEALDALQHIVNTVFRRELPDGHRVVVDALGFRKDKDAELREMTRHLIDRVKTTGAIQEVGPLNPYARRIVHLAVADDPAVASESIGDAFLKTVIISLKKG